MNYDYAIVLLRRDGEVIARAGIEPDWNPLLEAAHFEGARRGKLPALLVSGASLRRWRVTPVWSAAHGVPWVDALQVEIWSEQSDGPDRSDRSDWSDTVPVAYFAALAQELARRFLAAGASFHYRVMASERVGSAPEAPADGDFTLAEVVAPMPLCQRPLAEFGAIEPHALWFPVFVASGVLNAGLAWSQAAGDVETGGFLLGTLHRDRGTAEIFCTVTDQVPAQHTIAGATKLTFTTETWIALEADLGARRDNAIVLGWWHAHQRFCRLSGCPAERQASCEKSQPFFSEDDVLLHQTCFSRPYHLGLLFSDSPRDGWSATLFGWRHGSVAARGYQILPSASSARSDVFPQPV